MPIKRITTEEDINIDHPSVIKTTKTVVNPDIHTPVVDAKEEVVDSGNISTIKQSRVVHEPLIHADHPQAVYETKKTIFRLDQIIWYILTIIVVLLGFRMTLKAIGANPFSGFVSFIYTITEPLTVPFSGIIPPTVSGNSIIEWSTAIAALVFALIAWGIVTLIHMARPVSPEEVDQAV